MYNADMNKQATSHHPKVDAPSSGGELYKAATALGGGIFAAGLGVSFPLALVGCVVGYFVAHMGEKQRADESRSKHD